MDPLRIQLVRELKPSLKALTEALQVVLAPATGPSKQAVINTVRRQENEARAPHLEMKSDRTGRPVGSEAVRLKMAELRRLSSPSTPWCFRCGSNGHLTPSCRNAVVCFVCNRLGHRSSQCRSTRPVSAAAQPPIVDPPPRVPPLAVTSTVIQNNTPILPTPTVAVPLPSFPPSSSQIQSDTLFQVIMPSGNALRPAVCTFHATTASENLEAAFKMSFLLTDVER